MNELLAAITGAGVGGLVSIIMWIVSYYLTKNEVKNLRSQMEKEYNDRLKKIENVGLSDHWRDSLQSSMSEIFRILREMNTKLSEIGVKSERISELEKKLDDHVKNYHINGGKA